MAYFLLGRLVSFDLYTCELCFNYVLLSALHCITFTNQLLQPGLAETVQQSLPGAEVKSKLDSAECQAFQKCFAVLGDGISDPGWLAFLYSRNMISTDINQEAQLETLSALTRTRKLLSAVEDQILANPTSKFRDFLDVLNSEPSLEHLARMLKEAYSELKFFCVTTVMLATSKSKRMAML